MIKVITTFFHRIRLTAWILIFAVFLAIPAQQAGAATLTVTNTDDSGAGSLRQKVLDASAGDTINFHPSLAGSTISLTSEINLDKNLTLDGSGLSYQVQVIATGSVRLFLVSTGVTVTIDRLYMGNSTAPTGGAIYNDGDLTVSNSTFAGSSATSLGGAIYNNSSLTIANSTFLGNLAVGLGGAIYAAASSSSNISNSTFWDNDALHGGGIASHSTSTTTVNNSTFSGNSSTSPVPTGAAIYNSGVFILSNSILTANPGGSDCANFGSISSDHNVITDGTCSPYRIGSAYLSPLADNGGPSATMAIGASSSARNGGNYLSCEHTDQRGVRRDSTCDIGAYEYVTFLVVNSLDDPGDGICGWTSECTLRDAVSTIEDGGWIRFNPSLSGGTINLGSEIALEKDVFVDGSTLDTHIQVSGGASVRVFNIPSGVSVDIDHLDIINGGGVFGGGINNDGDLTVSNTNFTGHSVSNVGGAIYNSGTLNVTNCTLSANSTSFLHGAAIYNLDTLTVRNTTFTGNSAVNKGGGIYAVATTTTTISNSTFSGNSAPGGGGGIYNSGTLHLINSILADSTSGEDCLFSGGTFATNTNNLIEDGTCSPTLTGDPLLGPLADNGGPTNTMALLPGSPAIDAGDNPTCESSDQRGWSRPIDGNRDGTADCDIGAFEKTVDLFLPMITR